MAERITRMHLGGNRQGSTLRRTLAAILTAARRGDAITETALTAWMNAHLTVVAHTVTDPDTLGRLETDVLHRLDPPLNLNDMPASPVRQRLRQLRSLQTGDVTTPEADPDIGKRFASAMRDIYDRARAEAGYTATYFVRMLSDLGPLDTARRLLHSSTVSDGFTALWQRGRLDLTVEQLVRPQGPQR